MGEGGVPPDGETGRAARDAELARLFPGESRRASLTRSLMLLWARPGGESRLDGLEAGADDSLAKPYEARELLARVGAWLEIDRVHHEAGERIVGVYESITDGLI